MTSTHESREFVQMRNDQYAAASHEAARFVVVPEDECYEPETVRRSGEDDETIDTDL